MEQIINILLGLQIGFLGTAVYFSYKIMRFALSPTFPYKIAMGALILMMVWRLNQIFTFAPPFLTTITTTITAILWMIFFIKIYTLIVNKKYD